MSRRVNDFYPTPGRATEILIKYCPEVLRNEISMVWEVCNGDGAISDILIWHRLVQTVDIDPAREPYIIADAKTLKVPQGDSVVTNPPFLEAFEIVSNFVDQKRGPCAFLLRLSFLEPTDKRGEWLKNNPPNGMIVLPRISFTGDGKTDSVTCAWMLWNLSENFGVRIVPKSEFRGLTKVF